MTSPRIIVLLSLSLVGCGAVQGADLDANRTPLVDGGSPVDAAASTAVDAVSPQHDAWSAPLSDAGSTTLAGPEGSGPYAVTMSRTMLTGATAIAYVPTLAPGEHAPLVVFKHGFQLSSANYAMLLQRIATHGFVVIGVDTASGFFGGPTNIDERDAIVHAIDWALSTAPFASGVDRAHVAVMGHSRGGKDAVLAAAADPRITAALLLDPVNGCGPGMGFTATCPDAASASEAGALTIPVGVMGETNDGTGGFMPCAPTAQNYATLYAGIHASTWAVEWTFADAVHMTFTDDGGGSAGSFCAREPANVATLREDVRTMAVAFARYHLRGETGMAAWLTGASLPAGITRVGP